MSHTTEIKDVVIMDIKALELALAEIAKAKGVTLTLEKDAVPRGYFQNQEGLEKAPYVIKVGGSCRYDIGLYPNPNGKGYLPRTDLYGSDIQNVFGAKGKTDTDRGKLGQLYQLYAVHAATRQAIKQGYVVTRGVKADGTISLNITV